MVGEPERLRAFQDSLGGVPDRALTAADRRWMLSTLLLESLSSVKFFALERELGIGTSAVRAELDTLEGWLGPFDLSLVRRRGFGVAVEGPEFQKRLALAAALSQRFSEADLLALFRDAGRRNASGAIEDFLFARFPRAVVARVDALLDQASKKESWDWAPSAGLSLILHLVTALQRVAAGFHLDRVPSPDGDRGPARRLLESLSEAFGVVFPVAEVEWMALHLEASKPNRTSQPVRNPAPDLVRGVKDLVEVCTRLTGFPFVRDAVLTEGLTAHWGPALARLAHRLPIANGLLPEIRQRFPDLVDAVTKALAEVYPRLIVPVEEVGFLVLHFAAAVERSHRETVPFRALIVCSSGIGTSHMLASRIRAEVPEIEVVANLSWFEVKEFSRDRYDLLISTVPLPLPENDYVVVSPLLDEAGLHVLRAHIRLRRLGLTEHPVSGSPAPTLGGLKAWHRSAELLISLVDDLRSFSSSAVSWWSGVAAHLVEAQWLSEASGFPADPRPVPTGEPPVLVVCHPGARRSCLSIHPLPKGGRVALIVHPPSGFEPGEAFLSVLVEGLSIPEARAALASGNETELRAVLARTLGRNFGPRPSQGD
jgi:mannitol operon transcriptional antiterminator